MLGELKGNLMIVPFYVDYTKFSGREGHTTPPQTCYIVAAGRDYNEAALTALEICAATKGTPTEIREDI